MVAYFRSTGDMVWRRYNRNKRQTLEEEEDLEVEEEHNDDDDDEEDQRDPLNRQSRSVDPRFNLLD
jgi:hypothetical protein